MTSLNFGFSVTPGPAIELGAEMRRAEALGYSRVGVWDSPALFREPWVTLASVARDTTTMRVGTWVTNPISRHPVVTAASLATLADLAPGRAYLGIGSGGTGVWHLGRTRPPSSTTSGRTSPRSRSCCATARPRSWARTAGWSGPGG